MFTSRSGLIPASLLVLACLALVACNSDNGPGKSFFWDSDKEILGQPWDFPGPGLSLPENVEYAQAIVTVRMTDDDEIEIPPRSSGIYFEDPADKERFEADEIRFEQVGATTYKGEVQSWIRGTGDSTIHIRAQGGINPSNGTVSFFDEFFLLEPGRSYLLLLYGDATQGVYYLGDARHSFDITDGVKVLNHPKSHNLDYLEALPVDEFAARIEDLAALPSRDSASPFWDVSGDVIGSAPPVDVDRTATLGEMVRQADAVVKVGIDVTNGGSPLPLPDLPAATAGGTEETYRLAGQPDRWGYLARIQTWIKGCCNGLMRVSGEGGINTYDGSLYFPDGTFLLEEGRSYLLFLQGDDNNGYRYSSAREAFDVTNGVKVLNNPITRDLEYVEGLSVAEFVAQVREFANVGD